ncbi:MAG: Hpt domain-containing protein, partial [Spirochaetes bacterium]|nr:Hpt domain-containing protein [Spirochaetota bacterium]
MEYSEKLINVFQGECTDLLILFEENILLLDKEPENKELINELFRVVHSLKSETALMGFTNFSTIAHKLEDIFHQIRDNKLHVDDRFIELSLKIIDKFKEMLNLIITSSSDKSDISEIVNTLSSFMNSSAEQRGDEKEEASKIPFTLTKDEVTKYQTKGYKNIYAILIKLFENVALKYARAFLLYNNLSSIGDVVKSSVDFSKGGNDEQFGKFKVIVLSNKIEKEIYDLIDVSEVEKISIKKITKEVKEKKEEPKE